MCFLYSTNRYSLSTYSLPGIVLGSGDSTVPNTDKIPNSAANVLVLTRGVYTFPVFSSLLMQVAFVLLTKNIESFGADINYSSRHKTTKLASLKINTFGKISCQIDFCKMFQKMKIVSSENHVFCF